MNDTDYPSILRQTSWACQFVDFGKAATPNTAFFNCGLIKRHDGLWMISRRSRNMTGIRFGLNDLMAFQLNSLLQPVKGIPIQIQRRFPDEQWEDARAFYHKGRLYISFCNFVWTSSGWTGAHQAVVEVDSGWGQVRRFDPVYGNNGPAIGTNTGHEKNWVYFSQGDKLKMVYQSSPMTVVELSDDFVKTDVVIKDNKLKWPYGVIRGGTPPVLIDDLYWTFFHSSIVIDKPYYRRYYMGAFAFDPQTYEIVKITPKPLLAGSSHDKWNQGKPLVVFPCGSVFDRGEWIISMGVNDLSSAIIRIPHNDLLPLAKNVKFSLKSFTQPKRYEYEKKTVEIVSDKLQLKDVTLVCVDDRRPDLAEHAIKECTKRVDFGDVKFFTSKSSKVNGAVKIHTIHGLEDYCRFVVKDLNEHVKTSHCLIVQWDGYVLNAQAWNDDFLNYDYVGSPWPDKVVGNGGFSLRSKKLLEALQSNKFEGPFCPEDVYICRKNRSILESEFGIRFASLDAATSFGAELEPYGKEFGFHSFITPLPDGVNRPLVFNHSGDFGDIIYSLAGIKAVGGGVLILTPGHKYPTRQLLDEKQFANIAPLLRIQDYVFQTVWYGAKPAHTDYDLNAFREKYQRDESLFSQFLRVCRTDFPQDKPWLAVDLPVMIAERDIVVSRSLRYRNLLFPWQKLVNKYKARMIFVGTEMEHADFIRRFGYIPHYKTQTLLDVARVIQGAAFMIGNQSCPMAIALGLGVNVVQETWSGSNIELGDLKVTWDGKGDANCRFNRSNAIFVSDGDLKEIPFA